MNGSLKLKDNTIFLRDDAFHGLGWYGAGKLFAGTNVDGPVLFGYSVVSGMGPSAL